MQRAASERATCCTMCCTLHASCRPLDAVRRNVTGSCGSPPTRQPKAKASLRCIPTAMRCRAPTRRRRCVEKRQNALQVAAARREALTPLHLDAIWTVQHLTLHCVYRHADATCQPRTVATALFVRMRFHRCACARVHLCVRLNRIASQLRRLRVCTRRTSEFSRRARVRLAVVRLLKLAGGAAARRAALLWASNHRRALQRCGDYSAFHARPLACCVGYAPCCDAVVRLPPPRMRGV